MAAGPGISVSIDRKQFGAGEPLFAGFELEIAGGSVLAITGSSGVGKSTLLHMIAGIDRDFEGRIEIGGKPAQLAAASGFVPQDARLLPWLAVARNVGAIAPELSRGAIEGLLARVGMRGAGTLFPNQLSGGMLRRVALARALATNSALLLLDEPFVSLDPPLAREMMALLEDIIETSAPTVVLVTHSPEHATQLADKVVVLSGRPAEIQMSLSSPRRRTDDMAAELAGHGERDAALSGHSR